MPGRADSTQEDWPCIFPPAVTSEAKLMKIPPETDEPLRLSRGLAKGATKTRLHVLRAILFWATIVLGALQAFANRDHVFQEDAICYLDLSDAALQGNWRELSDSHWSPLYPVCLALFRLLLNPSPYWEPAVVKLTNFALFVLVAVAFEFFLTTFLTARKAQVSGRLDPQAVEIPEALVVCVLYLWFMWTALSMNGVHHDTPDLLVSGLILLASAITLRISSDGRAWRYYVLLGLTLGIGYLAKSIMFPLAWVFLVMSCFPDSQRFNHAIRGGLLATSIFFLFAIPQITLISIKAGHPTISDSAKLSYACYIQWKYQDHWPQGAELVHPPGKLFDHPRTFEFMTPVGGTYPPWYGMTYWFQGCTASFHPRVLVAVGLNLYCYLVWFAGPLIAAFLLQALICQRSAVAVGGLKRNWRLFVPALVGLTLYLPVVVLTMYGETRYAGVLPLLIVAGLIASIRIGAGKREIAAAAILVSALVLIPLWRLLPRIAGDCQLALSRPPYLHWRIARGLHEIGLKPGDRVCRLGCRIAEGRVEPCCPLYYWARLAGLRIGADVVNEDEFWSADTRVQARLLEGLRALGIKAVVLGPASNLPAGGPPRPWRKIAGGGAYVYLLTPALSRPGPAVDHLAP